MLRNIWVKSDHAANKLGISEILLSHLRENGFLKPGIHWCSSPYGQKKPWNPEVLYNTKLCRHIIKNYLLDNDLNKFVA